MIGVFMDTFVVLTLNALVIISTLYTPDGPLANGYTGSVTGILGKSNLAQTAFGTVLGSRFGAIFVAVCLFFFAFSTVLSWNLFGKINVIYLFGRENAKRSTAVYTVIALVFIFAGTMMSNDLVWELTDLSTISWCSRTRSRSSPSPAPLPPSQGTKQKHSCKKKLPPFRIGNGGSLLYFSADGIVVVHPVAHERGRVFVCAGAADDLRDAGVDDEPAAHGAGGRFRIIAAGGGVAPDKIERRAHHVAPRGGNDGVGLGVDAAAEARTALRRGCSARAGCSGRDRNSCAPSARGAVVAGGDDLVVTHDDRAELPPETGAALQSGFGNVEIVILLAAAVCP